VGSIPDDKVQEVRDRLDIVDLVGRYVDLRRAGRNYKGLCPFHTEKTPSFNVNPDRKGYKCFGCGAGGDGIGFVMEVEGKSFPEAVRKIAELYGVTLPEDTGRGGGQRTHEKDEAYAILRRATELYEQILWDDPRGEAARAYLQQRGLGDEVARRFRLGYAPAPAEGGWDTLCKALRADGGPEAGSSLALTERLGLVGRSERTGNVYDRFRGRLMFPVIQPGGEVVAFSGRVIPPHEEEHREDPPPKYINSPESLLFNKGKQLYGVATARAAIRSKRRAILVEGNVDVVKLHQWGHDETVAPLGTALTPEQARLLARFADQVIMCFDGDRAGKKAAWAALPLLLEADLDVRMVLLPEGEDPDSVGQERFGALLARPKPALEQMMIRIAARAGEAAHARGRALDRVLPLIAKVPRPSARELFANRAAELFGLPIGRVEQALRAAARGAEAESRVDSRGGRSSRASGPKGGFPDRGGGGPDGALPRWGRAGAALHQDPDPSTSGGAVPVSAAVRSVPPLPAAQAQLAMLLIDVPHLVSLAERNGALDCVADARLAPLVRRVVQSAKSGEDPSLSDLLDLVDAPAQQDVYRQVFAGQFRGSADPVASLAELMHTCRREALEVEIAELERRMSEALDAGRPDAARELGLRKFSLLRELDKPPATLTEAPPPNDPKA
jgi:DNA primase